MAANLAEEGFVGGASELSRAKVFEYWMAATIRDEACTRRMLKGLQAATGALAEGTRELAEGQAFNPQPFRRVLPACYPPYPEACWARLSEVCTAVIEESDAAHWEALAGDARGQDPAN